MHDLGAGPDSERWMVLIRGPLWRRSAFRSGMSGWRAFALRERFHAWRPDGAGVPNKNLRGRLSVARRARTVPILPGDGAKERALLFF